MGKSAGKRSSREARFTELFYATHQHVQAFARRRSPDHSSVDDVVAETFLVAWRRLETVPSESDEALLWLYQVALFASRNARRGHRRRQALHDRLLESAPSTGLGQSAERAQFPSEESEVMVQAFTSLPVDDRDVLLLAAWEGLTGPSLGAVLGCSPAAAATRLSRARARFSAAVAALERVEAITKREASG